MTKRILLVYVVLFLFSGSAGADKAPLTLADCYRLALKRSEDLAIKGDMILETEARFRQSLGSILPHFDYSYYYNWLDVSKSASAVSSSTSSTATSSSYSPHYAERKFTLTQPLFSGFKEFAAMKASGIEKGQREDEKRRAEELLLLDVANAFYLSMQQKRDLHILALTEKALVQQIHYLKKRERLGRSRKSEVANTEASLYRLKAEIRAMESSQDTARQLLEFLTGVMISDITEVQKGVPLLENEETYTAKSKARPDVTAGEKAWKAAKEKVSVARSGLFPSLSFETNMYTERQRSVRGIDWDAVLQFDVPLFEGTQVWALTDEANLKAHEAELAYVHTKRQAYWEIRDAYVAMRDGLLRVEAYKQAYRAAQKNYVLQKIDYRTNLVNNLDVLEALAVLMDARRDYLGALYDTKRFYWQLRVAVGQVEMGEVA